MRVLADDVRNLWFLKRGGRGPVRVFGSVTSSCPNVLQNRWPLVTQQLLALFLLGEILELVQTSERWYMRVIRNFVFVKAGLGGLVPRECKTLVYENSADFGPVAPNTLLVGYGNGCISEKHYVWSWKGSVSPDGRIEESFMLVPEAAWHVFRKQ